MKHQLERLKTVKLSLFTPVFFAVALALAGVGCSKRYSNLPAFSAVPVYDFENGSTGRFKTSYLADQINAYFRGNSNGPIAVATFVSLDDLYSSSTFGRFLSEQLISELSMRGFNVVELRHSDALQIVYNEGEFSLSREYSVLKRFQDVSAIVVGTYTVSPDRVYLNARVLNPKSSLVMSVGSVELAKTPEIGRLLRGSTLPATVERIPIRPLGQEPIAQAPMPYLQSSPPPIAPGKPLHEEAAVAGS